MMFISDSFHYQLFIGCKLTSQLKRQLERNVGWKNGPLEWKEIYHQNQEYLGIYLQEIPTSLITIQTIEKELVSALLPYCSDIEEEKLKAYVFPQLFIS